MRNGFTVLELLIVVGLIGLLVSLLIPAVQSARERARQVQCRSNLKQIMLAQHNYVDVYGVFPGVFNSVVYKKLGPYLGNSSEPELHPVFGCPSDPEADPMHSFRWGHSYFVNNGVHQANPPDGFQGANMRTLIGPKDVVDGLSNTAAMAERLAYPEWHGLHINWDDHPQHWIRKLRLTETVRTSTAQIAEECELRAGRPYPGGETVYFYNHILPPNSNSCTNGRPVMAHQPYAVSATSLHPQGVHVAMGDGAVRFVGSTVDRDVWWAVGTRSGQESFTW